MPKVTAIVSKVTNRPSLVQSHDYEVIGIDDEFFRIVDESGEPALYPKSFFLNEEISPPESWGFHDYGDGEFSYDLPEFAAIGFFEDYADGLAAAVQSYKNYLQLNNKTN